MRRLWLLSRTAMSGRVRLDSARPVLELRRPRCRGFSIRASELRPASVRTRRGWHLTDLTSWLTKSAAAARLSISERTLDRITSEGKPRNAAYGPDLAKSEEPVYRPEDVEALERAASPPMVFGPGDSIPGLDLPALRSEIPPALRAVLDLVGQLAAIAGKPAEQAQPPRLFLTIRQARDYTGLSDRFLRRLIHSGELPALKDGCCWKLRRLDLDNLASVSQLAICRATTNTKGRINGKTTQSSTSEKPAHQRPRSGRNRSGRKAAESEIHAQRIDQRR